VSIYLVICGFPQADHDNNFRYDFWKGLLIADIFIYVVYMIMGLVVYSNQGQYSFNPAYQGEL
jgi:hypothetical protein